MLSKLTFGSSGTIIKDSLSMSSVWQQREIESASETCSSRMRMIVKLPLCKVQVMTQMYRALFVLSSIPLDLRILKQNIHGKIADGSEEQR